MDEFILKPAVHQAVGGLTLLAALLAVVLTGRGALTRADQPPAPSTRPVLIALQVILMLQILVGIKLLDQGMGTLQKVVHYLGGLGALGFTMLYFWLPARMTARSARPAFWLSSAALAFVVMTFFIGQMYVRSQLSS